MMNKIFYYILATPIILLCKLIEFVVWEIVSTGWKKRMLDRYPRYNSDASDTIRSLRKKLEEKERREKEDHDSCQRQLKQKDEQIRRLSRK